MSSVTEDSISLYIRNQHTEISRRASNEIRLFLKTPINILETLVESEEIVSLNAFKQNLRLNKTVAKHPIFDRIFSIDGNNRKYWYSTYALGNSWGAQQNKCPSAYIK